MAILTAREKLKTDSEAALKIRARERATEIATK